MATPGAKPLVVVSPLPEATTSLKRSAQDREGKKKSRVDEEAKKAKDDTLVTYLRKNIRATTVAAGTVVYHAGSISEDDIEAARFDDERSTNFSFNSNHALSIGERECSDAPDAMAAASLLLKRSLIVLDFRPTLYASYKKKVEDKEADEEDKEEDDEEEEEDEDDEEALDDRDNNLFLGIFRDVYEDAIEEFTGDRSNDDDFADQLRKLNKERKLGFDGYVFFSEMRVQLVLFHPSAEMLEIEEVLNVEDLAQEHLPSYVVDSLGDDAFETISENKKGNKGDLEEREKRAEDWNRGSEAVGASSVDWMHTRKAAARILDRVGL